MDPFLLAFTVIHCLWITRASYVANVSWYTSPIFHMETDAYNVHNI